MDLTFRGPWVGDASYAAGDVVSYGSSTFVAFQPNAGTTPSPGTVWGYLARGFTWRGVWSSSTNYVVGDVVSFTDQSNKTTAHIAVANNINAPPFNGMNVENAAWNLMASPS